jgi:MFS family permease
MISYQHITLSKNMKNIRLIYLSNFLTGLVFWYGIFTKFYQTVGISASTVGVGLSLISVFTLLFDLPAGILADKWSRKRMLQVSAVALGVSSLLLANSGHSNPIFYAAYSIYGLYIVTTSGTYQAIMYDLLHEIGKSKDYSRLQGKAKGIFMLGAGTADLVSGWIYHVNIYLPFLLMALVAMLNIVVIQLVHEPTFHKTKVKDKFIVSLKKAQVSIMANKLILRLVMVFSALWIVDTFRGDFAQYWFLSYYDSAKLLGIFWAAFAVSMGFGSILAHRVKVSTSYIVTAVLTSVVVMCFWDSSLSLLVFIVHCGLVGMADNLFETEIQHNTQSQVRASIMSLVSTIGRIITVPTAIIMGRLIDSSGIHAVVRLTGWSAITILIVYVLTSMLSAVYKTDTNSDDPVYTKG